MLESLEEGLMMHLDKLDTMEAQQQGISTSQPFKTSLSKGDKIQLLRAHSHRLDQELFRLLQVLTLETSPLISMERVPSLKGESEQITTLL